MSYNTSFSIDTVRHLTTPVSFSVDTSRHLTASVSVGVDTVRRLPSAPTGVKSLSITLAAKTISDTFSMETVSPLSINDMVSGSLQGMDFSFLVEQTSQQGDIERITGTYGCDELLNELITYSVGTNATAMTHMHKIAGALGKTLVANFEDFTPSTDLSAVGTTYKDLISNLFGWSDVVPQRQINVFIRGSVIYCLQRGREGAAVVIGAQHTRPTITRKKLRTLRTSVINSTVGSFVVAPMPFSGTLSYGDVSVSFSAGLLMKETHPVDGATETTSYSYANGYITKKVTKGEKGTIETEYTYGGPSSSKLARETETTYDKNDKETQVRITRYFPIGYGWWATVVEVDKETTATSISQGAKGGKASIYSIEQSNRSLGSGYSKSGDGTVLPGESTVDTNFPITETAVLAELTAAIRWLNGRTEERATLDVYDMSAIDFTKVVILDGHTYHLERNVLSKDTNTEKQSLELVRWY